MTEAQLQEQVRQLCEQLGLYHYHPHDSRRSERGWPDSVIVGRRVLFRELKSAGDSASSEQRRLGWRLRAAGQDWDLWYPRDLRSGRIERELREIA